MEISRTKGSLFMSILDKSRTWVRITVVLHKKKGKNNII